MTAERNLPATVDKAPLRASGGGVQSIIPQDAEQAFRMAQLIFKSGFAPKDMQTAEKIVTAIIAGMEIGLKPFQSVQSFAVVNGRPTIWGDAAIGLVEASGYLEDIEETLEGAGDAMVATCRAKRNTRASPIIRTYSVADAKTAGLWGKSGPWSQHPKRMLQLRARAFALRDGFSDVLKGMRIQEEVADYSGPSTERHEGSAVSAAALLAQGETTETPELQSETIVNPDTGEVLERATEPAQATKPDAPKVSAATGWQPAILPPLRADGNLIAWQNDALEVINSHPVQAFTEIMEEMNQIGIPHVVHATLSKAMADRVTKPAGRK